METERTIFSLLEEKDLPAMREMAGEPDHFPLYPETAGDDPGRI